MNNLTKFVALSLLMTVFIVSAHHPSTPPPMESSSDSDSDSDSYPDSDSDSGRGGVLPNGYPCKWECQLINLLGIAHMNLTCPGNIKEGVCGTSLQLCDVLALLGGPVDPMQPRGACGSRWKANTLSSALGGDLYDCCAICDW